MTQTNIRIHPTAEVSAKAHIGKDSQVWNQTQIREDALIGEGCIFGKNVYVDFGVKIGNFVKVQNNSSLFHGVSIEDGVFIGPHVCLTNDLYPRAINPDFTPKEASDWEVGEITICKGASLGACTVVIPGISVGKFALVGSGSVVTKDVPDYGLVVGNPASLIGFVCMCGKRIADKGFSGKIICKNCSSEIVIK